jgi:hypothetical protein
LDLFFSKKFSIQRKKSKRKVGEKRKKKIKEDGMD